MLTVVDHIPCLLAYPMKNGSCVLIGAWTTTLITTIMWIFFLDSVISSKCKLFEWLLCKQMIVNEMAENWPRHILDVFYHLTMPFWCLKLTIFGTTWWMHYKGCLIAYGKSIAYKALDNRILHHFSESKLLHISTKGWLPPKWTIERGRTSLMFETLLGLLIAPIRSFSSWIFPVVWRSLEFIADSAICLLL